MDLVVAAIKAQHLKGVRQKQRQDGSWRVWWEPSREARTAGVGPVELPMALDDAVRVAREAQTKADRAISKAARRATTDPMRDRKTVTRTKADFMGSTRWNKLAAATRSGYGRDFGQIEKKWGSASVDQIRKPMVEAWYQDMRAQGLSARNTERLVRALSILLSHAERLGWRPENSNPCYRLAVTTAKPRSRVMDDLADLDALVRAAVSLGLPAVAHAVQLALFTGQRQTDIITARAADFADRPIWNDLTGQTEQRLVWSITQSKRGRTTAMPMHAEIEPNIRLRLARCKALGQDHLFLDDITAQPWSPRLFGKRWQAVRARAVETRPHLATLWFRDLRRSMGVLSRRAGTSLEDLGDLLGNAIATDPVLQTIYTPGQLATTTRAVDAIARPPVTAKGKTA